MRRARGLGLLVLCCAGCAVERDAAWLTLRGVEPALLEPGTDLRVLGEDLPVAGAPRVRVLGSTRRPGLAPLPVDVQLSAVAGSRDELRVPLGAADLRALGAHGSFEGELAVSWPTHDGTAALSGTHAARFDLVHPMHGGVHEARRVRERAGALLRFAGIEIARHAAFEHGLPIASVREGSAADALGLLPADVIVASAGVNVHTLGDLAPPPHARTLPLRVLRAGSLLPERTLSLHGFDAPDPGPALGRLRVLLTWVVSLALLISPLPSLAAFLRGLPARVRGAAPSALGWFGAVPPRRARRRSRLARAADGLRAALVPCVLSLLGVLGVRFAPELLSVRSLAVYLGLCALTVSLTAISDGPLPTRARAALGTIARMTVMGVLVACACAASGTRALDGMVATQGALPWQWAALGRPALLLAFPLYVVYAARLGAETLALAAKGPAAALVTLERVLTNVVLCAFGAAIFLGGWQSPSELLPPSADGRLWGALLYVIKVWALAGTLSLTRRLGIGAALSTWTVVATCAAVIALTGLWVWLEPSRELELAIGQSVLASTAIAGTVAMLLLPGRARALPALPAEPSGSHPALTPGRARALPALPAEPSGSHPSAGRSAALRSA